MIYMRNITITTAKSATYLENVGFDYIEAYIRDQLDKTGQPDDLSS